MKQINLVRKHIYFSGMVQGVGFRYRSYYIAQSLGLTGWVKNLWDGRVEMQVQGSEALIQSLIDRMKKESMVVIRAIEMEEIPVEDGEGSFKIGN